VKAGVTNCSVIHFVLDIQGWNVNLLIGYLVSGVLGFSHSSHISKVKLPHYRHVGDKGERIIAPTHS
jgi:hypothetical protein